MKNEKTDAITAELKKLTEAELKQRLKEGERAIREGGDKIEQLRAEMRRRGLAEA